MEYIGRNKDISKNVERIENEYPSDSVKDDSSYFKGKCLNCKHLAEIDGTKMCLIKTCFGQALYEPKEPFIRVNVLGTEYKVYLKNSKDEPQLEDADGVCDPTIKEIYIRENYEKEDDTVKDLLFFRNKIIRHEIIHAFLYESGLNNQSFWADNEELIDWIAIQLPKIIKALNKLEVVPSE